MKNILLIVTDMFVFLLLTYLHYNDQPSVCIIISSFSIIILLMLITLIATKIFLSIMKLDSDPFYIVLCNIIACILVVLLFDWLIDVININYSAIVLLKIVFVIILIEISNSAIKMIDKASTRLSILWAASITLIAIFSNNLWHYLYIVNTYNWLVPFSELLIDDIVYCHSVVGVVRYPAVFIVTVATSLSVVYD